MPRFVKEKERITKALDLNKNNPMSYEELRSALFNVKENVLLNVLSDMFVEGLIVSDGEKYQLPPILYAENVEKANKKKQSIIEANKRLSKIRDSFSEAYYKLDDARKIYLTALGSGDISKFEFDVKALGYTIANNCLIFQFASAGDFLSNELLKMDIIDINQFSQKYEPLVENMDFNYMLEKLKKDYKIIEFEKGAYINIKRFNQMGIFIVDIKTYCDKVYRFYIEGECFSIKSLRKDGFEHKLDDLGMEDIFYENLLRYDGRFLLYKMTNCYVFSTEKKPSVSNIVFDILKKKRMIDIYDLQNILKKEYGVATSIISDSGSLMNQSLIFDEDTTLFYSKEFEKIYFDKEDYYEEIEYDE